MAARARRCSLLEPGEVAVVTGQQIGLFLGPLYSVYKAATAVACARALELETGVRCRPVFWLQTEDHDAEEIDHVWVGARRLQVPVRLEPRCSVEHAVLGDEITAALEQLPDPALWAQHYRPGARWVDAFAGVMRTLFPSLLLVNPCEHPAPGVHARALAEAEPLSALLLERSRALEAQGFAVQVPVKPGAPLSFHHPEGARGPRHRLDSGARPTSGHFSTSALLRPIVQDTLLPTAAIVGGPGELNYFAQLSGLYQAFDLPMPMLVPRARFRVIDVATRRLLDKLGLKPADAEAPDLLSRLRPQVEPSPEAIEKQLLDAADAALVHVPLPDAVKRTRGTIARAASRVAGRYRRHLDTADTVLAERVTKLQASLFPHGEPQERVMGLPTFPGLDVLPHVEPWSTQVKDVFL
ncbi:MAG: bacillithiol biosynthesis BshC [Archangiaceae bacterium]|nr:bacillithiol biosynthesis BshC [Archangiaceae bacterium]